MIETWKDIPEYDGKYQADTEGNIRRVYKSGKTKMMTAYKKKMSGSQRLIVKLTKSKFSQTIYIKSIGGKNIKPVKILALIINKILHNYHKIFVRD